MIPSEEVSARRREIEDKLKQVPPGLGRAEGAAGAAARARSPLALPGRRGWVWRSPQGLGASRVPSGASSPPPGSGAYPGPLQGLVCRVRGISALRFGPGLPFFVLGSISGLSLQVLGRTSPARLPFPLCLGALGTESQPLQAAVPPICGL